MTLKEEYGELEARAKKFKKYERIIDFLVDYWYFGIVIALALDTFVLKPFFGGEAQSLRTLISFGIVFVPWTLLSYVLIKKTKKYRPEDDEWATFYSYSILDNLRKYSKTTSLGMKEDYRKNAVKNSEEFLSCIKKRWRIGNFKLAQDYFGKPVSKLKKNLQYRVIPNLKKGDDELLDKIEQQMRNFFRETRNLSVESINNLNKGLSENLPSYEKMKIGLRASLANFFSTHKILKHGMVVSSLVIGCCAFFFIAVTYAQIPREYAFGGSVALFLGLLTIYSRSQPKES